VRRSSQLSHSWRALLPSVTMLTALFGLVLSGTMSAAKPELRPAAFAIEVAPPRPEVAWIDVTTSILRQVLHTAPRWSAKRIEQSIPGVMTPTTLCRYRTTLGSYTPDAAALTGVIIPALSTPALLNPFKTGKRTEQDLAHAADFRTWRTHVETPRRRAIAEAESSSRDAPQSQVTLQVLGAVLLVCLGLLLGSTWTIQVLQTKLRQQAEERRKLNEEWTAVRTARRRRTECPRCGIALAEQHWYFAPTPVEDPLDDE
jgi:hypothetical protein